MEKSAEQYEERQKSIKKKILRQQLAAKRLTNDNMSQKDFYEPIEEETQNDNSDEEQDKSGHDNSSSSKHSKMSFGDLGSKLQFRSGTNMNQGMGSVLGGPSALGSVLGGASALSRLGLAPSKLGAEMSINISGKQSLATQKLFKEKLKQIMQSYDQKLKNLRPIVMQEASAFVRKHTEAITKQINNQHKHMYEQFIAFKERSEDKLAKYDEMQLKL